MIIERTFYAIQCDSCKIKAKNYEDRVFWQDKSRSREEAIESEWHEEKDKHYCPECYSFDEETTINMKAKDFYEQERLNGNTENITASENPDYNLKFYLEIFKLMEGYRWHQTGKSSVRKGEKCCHCESDNRNTIKMDSRQNGTEDWKCLDCGGWFLVGETIFV